MSVFGSLFTAVSALTAQGQSLAMISDNISNVSTVGYKRTDAQFSSLVTTSGTNTAYTPGSVSANQSKTVAQQGILQQTSSSTDLAISGNGFFVVQRGTEGEQETLYTRAGSYTENEEGFLTNTSGFVLMGWPLDQDSNLPSNPGDLSSLVPVDVAFLGGLTQATTSAALSVNLDSTNAEQAYPVVDGFTEDFSRVIRVYDSLGEGQDLTINFAKHESPTATVTGTTDLSIIDGDLATSPGIDATDTFDLTVGGITQTITLDGDLAQVVNDINGIEDGVGNRLAFAELSPTGRLIIKTRALGDTVTLADGLGTPLVDAFGMTSGVTAPPTTPNLLAAPLSTPNSEGWWHMNITGPNGEILTEGSMNFDGNGQLNAAEDADGLVLATMSNIDWGNGSSEQDINFDMSSFTQFSGDFNVISSTQNGAELGLRTSVSIDRTGNVTAQFSNGQSTQIYKLPLATFANANGLNEESGNVYSESDNSGGFNLREAGQGSAGLVEGGALEGSNVDLADEFSKMIVTQRAYSAGTKVITTADQMTEELLRLR